MSKLNRTSALGQLSVWLSPPHLAGERQTDIELVLLKKENVDACCRESSEGVCPPGLLAGKTVGLFDPLLLISSVSEIIHSCLRLLYSQRNMKERTLLMLA